MRAQAAISTVPRESGTCTRTGFRTAEIPHPSPAFSATPYKETSFDQSKQGTYHPAQFCQPNSGK